MPCGTPDNVKRWSLTLFRHGPQGVVSDLEDSLFRFGRSYSEMEYITHPVILPKALIHAVEEAGIQGSAMESGLQVELSTGGLPDDSEGWFDMEKVIEGTESKGGSRRMRWTYFVPETLFSMVVVQVNRLVGSEMPDRIWIRVSELPPSSLIWAMDNGILEEGNQEGGSEGQRTLAEWVIIRRGIKLEGSDAPRELVFPGKPLWKYVFDE